MKLHHLPLFVTGLTSSNVVSLNLHEGRLSTVMTKNNINAVWLIMESDKKSDLLADCTNLGIGMRQVNKIFHEHLADRKLCTRWIPNNLTAKLGNFLVLISATK
ncbi:hypothetical protein EVAR_2911_1 [Eumeta japonica]|uniref:Uncharacterized protein n=1 Tax=Eumeta variegata TaxID=151549 RepID=A0A4C1T0R3_EUMVA|nr:hypothetical protein EVAR_2911_1 [Eumeta japonica]